MIQLHQLKLFQQHSNCIIICGGNKNEVAKIADLRIEDAY